MEPEVDAEKTTSSTTVSPKEPEPEVADATDGSVLVSEIVVSEAVSEVNPIASEPEVKEVVAAVVSENPPAAAPVPVAEVVVEPVAPVVPPAPVAPVAPPAPAAPPAPVASDTSAEPQVVEPPRVSLPSGVTLQQLQDDAAVLQMQQELLSILSNGGQSAVNAAMLPSQDRCKYHYVAAAREYPK